MGTGLAIIKRIVAAENNSVAAILALDPFERFVFVISVLEGRPEQDCAILLRSLRRDITIARVLALKRLANSDAAYAQADELMQPNVLASGLAATSGALQKASEVGWILLHLGLAQRDLRESNPVQLERED